MKLAVCSLASGSSGNCFLVRTENTAVLVDAGISGRQVANGLSDLGISIKDISAVLITHEHSDHIKGLKIVQKNSGACVYASKGTVSGIPFSDELKDVRLFVPGDEFLVGDLNIKTFRTSHDAAEPCGYSFTAEGKQVSIVTDTGCVSWEVFEQMKTADVLVLESNHDESVLRMGRYPWFLKQRILSDRGHLSNDAAANALLEVLRQEAESGTKKRRLVLLAHLSKENNFPEMALQTMSNILSLGGFAPGADLQIRVLSRSEPSPLYIL